MLNRVLLAAVVLCAGPTFVAGGPEDEVKTPPEAPKLPLELILINKGGSYEVDARGTSPHKFQENLRAAEKTGKLPFATRVEMELEIKNTTTRALQVWISGDPTEVGLDLKGGGALSFDTRAPKAAGRVAPKAVTIAGGKSYKLPLTSLSYGFRNDEKRAYITEPGLYTLSATFKTGINPAPIDAKPRENGFGEVFLKSAPIKLRVVRAS